MNVSDLEEKQYIDNEKRILVRNPLSEEFSVGYSGQKLTILGLETKEFSAKHGQHLAKHLADRILHERSQFHVSHSALPGIMKEILV